MPVAEWGVDVETTLIFMQYYYMRKNLCATNAVRKQI